MITTFEMTAFSFMGAVKIRYSVDLDGIILTLADMAGGKR